MCKILIRWSYCFWLMALIFLVVPQACASPSISSCQVDPASSLYNWRVTGADSCYGRCFTNSCSMAGILLFVLNLVIFIRILAARRDPPCKKNESVQCV